MISIEAAQQIIADHVAALATETVPLAGAVGRVLRSAVVADTDQPPFDRSAVDGYAICGVGSRFRLIGAVSTGGAETWSLPPQSAVRIYTGGRVPAQTEVIMQEHVNIAGDEIEIRPGARPNQIRRQGEDAGKGDVLVPTGIRLNAVTLSVLASVGATQPSVSRQPRVAHLVTGNEIVAPEEIPTGTQVRDVNSLLIRTLVEAGGAEMILQQCWPDEAVQLREAAGAALTQADLLLISGGASVGDFDYGKRVLEQLGFTLHFQQVNVRPGKPLVFATRGNQVAMVLPGNPVSHLVCFHLFVRVVLDRLLECRSKNLALTGRLADDFAYQMNARETFWPCALPADKEGTIIKPLRWESSGHLAALVGADGFMRIPAGTGPMVAGQIVEAVLWPD